MTRTPATHLSRRTPRTLPLLFVLALALLFALALRPAPEVMEMVESQDKIGHFVAFLFLALLGFAAWPRRVLTVAAILLLYGVAMEVGQSFTEHRHGDAWDWVADALGVAAALLVHAGFQRLRLSRAVA